MQTFSRFGLLSALLAATLATASAEAFIVTANPLSPRVSHTSPPAHRRVPNAAIAHRRLNRMGASEGRAAIAAWQGTELQHLQAENAGLLSRP